jgi:hypothetical protein
MRTGEKGTQFGPPAKGRDASSRAARGRVCGAVGCDTVLSTYNSANMCWMHEPAPYRPPLYETKRRG